MAKTFDVIVFGASGFTGQFVVEEMATITSKENISWAVAGRNHHKVQQTLDEVRKSLSSNLKEIEIFEADVTNQTSLENMCRSAKLIINCVGPYEKYGEPVVMACLKHKTHLIDMTVEIMYIQRTILRYFHEAQSQEVYIISACGAGYLPLEMPIPILQQQFEGDISSIDFHLQVDLQPKSVHFGTWDSVVNMTSGYYDILVSRQQIYSQIMNRNQSKWNILSPSWPITFCEEVKSLRFLVPSPLHTLQLSQNMKEDVLHQRPMKVNFYFAISSWLALIRALIFIFFALCLIPFSFGKQLVTEHPELFSFGVVTKSDMIKKKDAIRVCCTAVAKGWRKKQHSNPKFAGNPDKTVIFRASVPDIYKTTAVCLVQSAITVLKESHRLPNRGGVYTPLAAFAETSLPSTLFGHIIPYQLNEK